MKPKWSAITKKNSVLFVISLFAAKYITKVNNLYVY